MRKLKLQSAMEYLMTYGWAILIIAVVLGVLFQMGVFNSSSLTVRIPPGACKVLRTSAAVNLVGQCSGILPQYVAQFDGASTYVNVGTSSRLHFSSPFTVSAWVRLSSYGLSWDTYEIISDYNGAYKGYKFTVGTSGNLYLQVGRQSDTSLSQAISTQALSLNTWYYVVGVYDGARPIVYVNGVVTNGGAYSPIQAETASSLIGKPQWFPGYFNGQIANIQVYNTSLDASQVQTLYQEGIGGVPVSPQYLVGWWPLNSDANDYSGNNNNGAATALTYTAQYGK